MGKYASEVVKQAQAWVGLKESDGSHKKIIDIYNRQNPLPVGYRVKYYDAWCATFVSAVVEELGYRDIIPTECSCPRMITLFKKAGIWVENENRIPNPGDIIFYDWDDKSNYASTDNTGSPEHVGIVEKINGNYIIVIEGNYKNGVNRRTISINGRYIRGYGVPKYDAEVGGTVTPEQKPAQEPAKQPTTSKEGTTVDITLNVLRKGDKGEQVKALQRMLHVMGYNLGTLNPIDGSFGAKTDTAVRNYQRNKGLLVDGIVGEKTWNKLLKG